MRKKTDFSFVYPIARKIADPDRTGGFRHEHIADLEVSGVGFYNGMPAEGTNDQYELTLEEVLYEGKNILNLLTSLEALNPIIEASYHHIQGTFSNLHFRSTPAALHAVTFNAARVISFPLQQKAN